MIKTQILRKEEFATPTASLKLASPQKMPVPKPPPRINVGIQRKPPLSNYQLQNSNQEMPTVPKRKDSKLDKALNDFDQIVQDFMSAPYAEKTSKIPKLQKAKTCCVIESKSVYKRTLSAPAGCQPSQMKKKTKSLLDLHQDDEKNNETKNDNVRDVIMKFNILTSTPKKDSTLLKNFEFSENNHNSFLNEATIDCSSVGEENDLSVASQLDDDARKFKEILPHRSVSRSTSTNSDYNEDKKNSISRIPVNTHLRKSFPSTPLGLNKLDQQNGSQFLERTEPKMQSKFSKSVQNLTKSFKLSAINTSTSNLSKRNCDLSRSTHNLSKTSNKVSVTKSSNLNTSRSKLVNSDMKRSTQNISKSSPKLSLPKSTTTRMNSNLSKSVHNLANNSCPLSLSNSTKINRVNSVDISRSVNNLNKISSKFSPVKTTNLIKAKNIEFSKSVQNLNKVSSKIALAKASSNSPDNIQNISKSSLDVSSKSDIFVQTKRDFVNANIKSSTPHFHKENVEAEIEEMKKVIEAKIDQQLKELSFEEIDGQIKGSVKSKVEQYSKNIEEEEEKVKDCFVGLKCPKDIEIKDIIEKFSGTSSMENTPVSLNNPSTFKKKISAFSNFVVGDKAMKEPVEKLPPKVTPRTKSSLKKADHSHSPSKCDEKINSEEEVMISKRNHEVFGVKKHFVDSKYLENIKSLSPLRKNNMSKNSLELNLNTRSGSDLSKGISAKEKSLKTWLDNKQLGKRVDCNMNYGSDDSSSDDSGNISTEIENDDCVSPIDEPPGNLMLPAPTDEVFLRNGVLTQLEAQRDECLGGVVVKLQARCRGYLARRRLSQRKLQDLAVRCIQRNVRKFMLVRDWPWWRLLVRVTPLLNVHRTEEKLKLKTEELEALKAKFDKLEQDRTLLKHENDKLEAKMSEMTADLAEEHSAATLATERLDAETSERIRLERELSEVQAKNKELNRNSERLEMELLYARSDLNGISEEDDEDNDGENGGVYKQRYERVFRELEFTKRRLRQQHEDDLEQLVGLKKQLEKKLNDAYEEAEEQRQVVGQWKNKVQKLNGEMNDLKLLIEEQSARNNLLEKKQRRFDSETQMMNDELKMEKNAKDRISREKEILMTEKYSIETNLANTKLELELKEEKLNALQREYDEITCGERTEEEVTTLRRQKIEMERRLQDQEEELDELASQVQLLEQAKLRLEMSLESMRKEAKKETQLRDDELEEMRGNAQKRVKALEAQLENEHEERTMLLRQKHELERRLASAAESERHDRQGDEVIIRRLKNDLRKTKALLRDCQMQLDMQKADMPGKNVIRQLKNQLEDTECARALAVKSKQSLESELAETQLLLDESTRLRREAEERSNLLSREKGELQSQLEENEEELAEVFKKYKAAVQQMSLDQVALQEQVSLVSELEIERNQLKEQLTELTSKLENAEFMGDASSSLLAKRNEFKVKELESKLDLEQSTRSRLEVQISRLKEAAEKLQAEISASKAREQQAHDQIRKLQRALRETKEELSASISRESDAAQKRKELEKRLENLEAESAGDRNDLRLAKKRIEDLQVALQGELGDSVSDPSESDLGDSDCDSIETYMPNHRGSILDSKRLDNLSRSSTTSSNLGKEATFT